MTLPRTFQCPTRKICNWTAEDAQLQIDSMTNRGQLRGRVHVYLCPKCGFYHVGHYDPEVVKKHARWKQILLERAANRKQRHEKENREARSE